MSSQHGGPRISSGGGNLPSRVVYYGLPGTGKTSFATNAPRPIFLPIRGETGLFTLIDAGVVPETPHFDECMGWAEFESNVRWLSMADRGYKTLVIDALGGLETLIFEKVCQKEFGNQWSKFWAFQKGPETAMDEIEKHCLLLDELRRRRCMGIILLAHARVKKFKNVDGDDFNHHAVDCEDKTWAVVNRWADMVLFVQRQIVTAKDQSQKVRAAAGELMAFTQPNPSYQAKNRSNLPESFGLGASHRTAWAAFIAAVKAGRQTINGARSRAEAPVVPEPAPAESVDRPEEQPSDNPETATTAS